MYLGAKRSYINTLPFLSFPMCEHGTAWRIAAEVISRSFRSEHDNHRWSRRVVTRLRPPCSLIDIWPNVNARIPDNYVTVACTASTIIPSATVLPARIGTARDESDDVVAAEARRQSESSRDQRCSHRPHCDPPSCRSSA